MNRAPAFLCFLTTALCLAGCSLAAGVTQPKFDARTVLPYELFSSEGSTLLVRKGDTIFGVTAARSLAEPDLEMAKLVAERVLNRIE